MMMRNQIALKIVLTICFILTFNMFARDFSNVDLVIENAIQNKIFPAASIIVGTDTSIIFHKAYGKLTYDGSSTPTDTSVMFDLASLTKVMHTTMLAMKLYDLGMLSLEEYVWQTIPEFAQNGKDSVKIKNLLLHNSGLPIGYGSNKPRDQIIYEIMTIALAYPLGTFVYSDLSMVVLAEVISMKVDTMFHYYYKTMWTDPLGMFSTMFKPPEDLDYRIAPTVVSLDPGTVHDPLARSLNGLSGNAGLFSTTGDLAKMAQLLLAEGVYKKTRYLSQSTVQLFRTRYDPQGSSRALGWDTNAPWMGTQLSDQTFGHTGYTGTSIAIDPVRNLFIIMLTNRTYPDVIPDMLPTRQLVHDAVADAIDSIPELRKSHGYNFRLDQNYPNPFNTDTIIEFFILKTEHVTLKIYNLLGQPITTLVSNKLNPGVYHYRWKASNLPSNIYYSVLEAGDYQEVKKMILVR